MGTGVGAEVSKGSEVKTGKRTRCRKWEQLGFLPWLQSNPFLIHQPVSSLQISKEREVPAGTGNPFLVSSPHLT